MVQYMIEYVSMEPSRQENQSVELHIRRGRTGDIFLNLRHQGVNGSNFGAQAFHVLVQLRHRLAARVGKWVGFWNNHAMPSCYPIPFVCIYSVLIIGVDINIYIYISWSSLLANHSHSRVRWRHIHFSLGATRGTLQNLCLSSWVLEERSCM